MVATIKTDRIETALGKAVELTGQAAAKAYAQYKRSTTTINSSFNVTSLTDNGNGDFSVGLTSAAASMSEPVLVGNENGTTLSSNLRTYFDGSSSTIRQQSFINGGGNDSGEGTVALQGDLA